MNGSKAPLRAALRVDRSVVSGQAALAGWPRRRTFRVPGSLNALGPSEIPGHRNAFHDPEKRKAVARRKDRIVLATPRRVRPGRRRSRRTSSPQSLRPSHGRYRVGRWSGRHGYSPVAGTAQQDHRDDQRTVTLRSSTEMASQTGSMTPVQTSAPTAVRRHTSAVIVTSRSAGQTAGPHQHDDLHRRRLVAVGKEPLHDSVAGRTGDAGGTT